MGCAVVGVGFGVEAEVAGGMGVTHQAFHSAVVDGDVAGEFEGHVHELVGRELAVGALLAHAGYDVLHAGLGEVVELVDGEVDALV